MKSTRKLEADHPRLYGRAQGRPLSKRQEKLVADLLPKVAFETEKSPLSPKENPPRIPLWLEIGFGGAEHLIHRAKQNLDVQLVGVEPFLNGIAKALVGIEENTLSNVRLHHGDARLIIDKFAPNSLSKIFVLFPDPWPKQRHFKRRILSSDFIQKLYSRLKPGGELQFASDIISYVDWVLARIDKLNEQGETNFIFSPETAGNWRNPPPDWPGTRYEAKAKREGRHCHYFSFIKPISVIKAA